MVHSRPCMVDPYMLNRLKDLCQNRILRCILVTCAFVLSFNLPGFGVETALSEGIDFYKAGHYSRAKAVFDYIISKEPNNWQARYELGNTLVKMNELPQAKEQYLACLKVAPDANVAKSCGQVIAFIDHSTGVKPYEGSTATTTTTTTTTATTGQGLKERITIVAPQYDHPQVSEATVITVRKVVDNLPNNIYEILSNGGATVNISPNITDRWPDMLKGKLDAQGLALAQDCARCYDKNVYIYERKLIAGTTRLGDDVFDAESVTNVLKHELGHATDVCSGTFTNTPEFLAIHQKDMDAMSDDVKHRLWYYTKPGYTGAREAFAETFAGLLGANGKDTEAVRDNFPLIRAWARDKLKL